MHQAVVVVVRGVNIVRWSRASCSGIGPGWRGVIFRGAFNGFKHWRGQATRYDKHVIVYRGGLVLAAVAALAHRLWSHVLVATRAEEEVARLEEHDEEEQAEAYGHSARWRKRHLVAEA